MSSLYPTTLPQAADKGLERNTSLSLSFVKCSEILGIFSQGHLHRLIHYVRDRSVGGRGLQPQRLVNIGVEIDGGTLGIIHGGSVTL
jgi:hypothetical protein